MDIILHEFYSNWVPLLAMWLQDFSKQYKKNCYYLVPFVYWISNHLNLNFHVRNLNILTDITCEPIFRSFTYWNENNFMEGNRILHYWMELSYISETICFGIYANLWYFWKLGSSIFFVYINWSWKKYLLITGFITKHKYPIMRNEWTIWKIVKFSNITQNYSRRSICSLYLKKDFKTRIPLHKFISDF